MFGAVGSANKSREQVEYDAKCRLDDARAELTAAQRNYDSIIEGNRAERFLYQGQAT